MSIAIARFFKDWEIADGGQPFANLVLPIAKPNSLL